tara:strand:- start:427 stop:552 length:126 start_codon:yes stop_codon:yes gene_type:complete
MGCGCMKKGGTTKRKKKKRSYSYAYGGMLSLKKFRKDGCKM